MVKGVLTEQDVRRRLERAIRKIGNQSKFARHYGVDRPYLNNFLHGNKPPPIAAIQALKLKPIVAGVSRLELLRLLKQAIARAGSISEFSRRTGLDRSFVSLVVNGKRPASAAVFRALDIEPTRLYVSCRSADGWPEKFAFHRPRKLGRMP
jgi:DNA-binding transcriptional regulator YdaS (Cro superfamily)